MRKAIVVLLTVLCLCSCTEQGKVKNYGGTMTVNLPQNVKLVNVTWKDDDLWYLTRQANLGERAVTYKFSESSSWGVFEGTIIIIEHVSAE